MHLHVKNTRNMDNKFVMPRTNVILGPYIKRKSKTITLNNLVGVYKYMAPCGNRISGKASDLELGKVPQRGFESLRGHLTLGKFPLLTVGPT